MAFLAACPAAIQLVSRVATWQVGTEVWEEITQMPDLQE